GEVRREARGDVRGEGPPLFPGDGVTARVGRRGAVRRGAAKAARAPQARAGGTEVVMAVSWIALHLTDRCQLDCQHCLRDPGLIPKDLPLPIIQKVLSEARTVYQSA